MGHIMRFLTDHIVNPANDKLKIRVSDDPGSGGAHHRYDITGFDDSTNPSTPECDDIVPGVTILFQNGPIAEAGVNGVTHEALLAVLADRLRCFQAGPFACAENAEALAHLESAQEILQRRTKRRMAAGTEGTHKLD
jgi:hypothetical protein